MKILYLYQYFSTEQGSWGTRAYEFSRRWVREGDQVTMVTSVYDKSDLNPKGLIDRLETDGIDVRVVNVKLSNKHGLLMRVLTFMAYTMVASAFALFARADVVLASSGPLTIGIPGLVARWIRRRPLVFEIRDLFTEGVRQLGIVRSGLGLWALQTLETRCCKAANEVVALSPGMAEWVHRHAPKARVHIIPNAADIELFGTPPRRPPTPAPDRHQDHRWAVYAGTLGRANQCEVLLDVAEMLQRQESSARILLIGDGSERARLQQESEDRRLTHIRFIDLMPRSSLSAWLAEATMTLLIFRPLPVLDTTSPNKLFDSLAAGVPVIQTTQGWIRDLLEKEQCGLTVDGQNATDLASAIERIATDETLREAMSQNARRVALEQFDRNTLSDQMRAVLYQATGKPVPTPLTSQP